MKKTGCICIDVRTVANRLTQLYDNAMAPSGMTVTQFSQLNAIQQLGSPTVNELSEAIGLDRSTLGRNVRVLEKDDGTTHRIPVDYQSAHSTLATLSELLK